MSDLALGDLYAGEPIVLAAKVERFAGEVVVRGRRAGEDFESTHSLEPGESARGIGVLWARRKIAHWMGQHVFGVAANEIRKEVLAVALEHQLVSSFTSLVAVDVTPTRPVSGLGAGTNVPNHVPAGFVPGVLPKGATPAPLFTWLGSVLLLSAGWLSRRRAQA